MASGLQRRCDRDETRKCPSCSSASALLADHKDVVSAHPPVRSPRAQNGMSSPDPSRSNAPRLR